MAPRQQPVPLTTFVEYVDPEEVAYRTTYQATFSWLSMWLPTVPQNLDMWRTVGTIQLRPPDSDLNSNIERDWERLRWVATLANDLISNGGRISSIGYWKNDKSKPRIQLTIAIGTVVMRHRTVDVLSINLDHYIDVADMIELVEANDALAIQLQEHLLDAEERLLYSWGDICQTARDYNPLDPDA